MSANLLSTMRSTPTQLERETSSSGGCILTKDNPCLRPWITNSIGSVAWPLIHSSANDPSRWSNPSFLENVDELLARLRKALNTNQVVDLSGAYAALTVDIVSEYAFGECTNSLQKDGWWLHRWTYYILESRSILLPGNFPGSSTPCSPRQLALWPS
jgi:hypothetical protein